MERIIEPKSDMAGIITQLSHLAPTTRYQVIKMAQYIGESKGWSIVNDWKLVSCKTKYISKTLLDFRYTLKPIYSEGDLVRVADLFLLRNDYSQPITEMDHQIDRVSGKVIKEYEDDRHIVNTDDDDRYYLKKYARKHHYFAKKGRMVTSSM